VDSQFFCLDVDIGEHSAESAANAIRMSVNDSWATLKEFVGDRKVVMECITGDSGGGAAVQHLHPKLQSMDILEQWSRWVGCDMHGLQKPFEVALSKCLESKALALIRRSK